MAVFRIERTRDYTVMSNHHLRNGKLSLKAKGLLSMMLSLPEDWNYTTRGLAYANKKIEELDTRRQTISKAIAELSVEIISPQQIKKLSYYLDNWDSIDFDDKRKAADGLISTIKATSDRVQIEWKI